MSLKTPLPGGGSGSGRILLCLPTTLVLTSLACSPVRSHERFRQTFETPEALATEFLDALEARDRRRLEALPLDQEEFGEQVFPEMPAWGKVPTSFVWGDLRDKGRARLEAVLSRHGGRSYRLERVAFDGDVRSYRSFLVHRRPRLHVRDRSTGERHELAVLGSILEYEERHKLFSYVVSR